MYNFLVKCLLRILSVGPIPNHIAFIMDGNRRFAKKKNLEERDGYRAGFLSLMFMLKQCYELGIRYISIYSFSIDNFNRRPEEIEYLMELMQEKVEGFLEYEGMITKYGIRVIFVGDLSLLSESLREAAEKAMEATKMNTRTFLLICVAYNSTDEIVRAVEKTFSFHSRNYQLSSENTSEEGETASSAEKNQVLSEIAAEYENENENADDFSSEIAEDDDCVIKLKDIEKELYMSIAPEPDIIIRSSGATRLSNFLLWQTPTCLLDNPAVLWPEIGLRHLVWAVLKFQRYNKYIEKKREKLGSF